MNRKISFGAALALALVLVAVSIPLTMLYARKEQNNILANLPARAGLFASVGEVEDIAEQNALQRPNANMIAPELVRGFIAGLGDSHSRYLNAEDYALYEKRLSGETADLGFEASYAPPTGVVVTMVRSGSTAANAGLKEGDVITRVEADNRVVFTGEGSGPEDVTQLMKDLGSLGSSGQDAAVPSVIVTFLRDEVTHTEKISFGDRISTVYGSLQDGNIGYIRIAAFFKTTKDQLTEEMKKLFNQGATSLLLDLRGCSEGSIGYACEVLDLIVPAGAGGNVMATVTYREGREAKTYPSSSDQVATVPNKAGIIVLLNHETDGVAELFAYDIKAYGMAQLVGEASAGNGLVQEAFKLKETGGAVLLTTGTIEPYDKNEQWCGDGTRKGVQPDVAIGNPEMQLETAKQLLLGDAGGDA
jgi:carboxyl-terminal processing protease